MKLKSQTGWYQGRKALAAAFLGVLTLVGGSAQNVFAEEIVGRLSYHWGPSHTAAGWAVKFAEEVNRRGEGRIRIDVYPQGQLFGAWWGRVRHVRAPLFACAERRRPK